MKKFFAIWFLVFALLAYVIQLAIFLPLFFGSLANIGSSVGLLVLATSLVTFAETSFSPVVIILLSLLLLHLARKEVNEKSIVVK